MGIARKNPTPAVINIARSACAADVFAIRAFTDRRAIVLSGPIEAG